MRSRSGRHTSRGPWSRSFWADNHSFFEPWLQLELAVVLPPSATSRMTRTLDPVRPSASTLRHFHVLAKPTGAICNLDCKYCFFLSKDRFLVGLSMDGPREMMAAARLMQTHGVEFNILTTVHAGNAGHPLEVYRFLRDEVGTKFIPFIPIVERVTPELLPVANRGWGARGSDPRPLYLQEGGMVTDRSVQPEAWGRFLSQIFDEWITRDVGTVFVQMFDASEGESRVRSTRYASPNNSADSRSAAHRFDHL